jgi:hypothetical protein
MKCTNKAEAQRIAYFGSLKMKTGYTMVTTGRYGVVNVVKEDGETTYRVNIGTPTNAARFCNCGFFTENAEFGICKHIYFAQGELEKAASFDALVREIETPAIVQEARAYSDAVYSEFEYYNGRRKA